jgi:hypothetical protein
LTPKDYTVFFEKVIRGNNNLFMGELHAELLKKSREEVKGSV